MTDDERAVARPLLELLVADEPPLTFRPADLAAAGRRRKAGTWAAAAAVVATVATVLAAVTVAAARPQRPTYRPAPPPSVVLVPAPDVPDPTVPGPVDVLTPAQEQALVAANGAVFDRVYRAPAGWRVVERVPFRSDPGISDEAWNGGVDLADPAGRVASVGVGLARHRGSTESTCRSSRETVPLPGGGAAHVERLGAPTGLVTVCWKRPDGVEVSALTARGPSTPGKPVRSAPVVPEAVARLAALVADPGWAWPR